MNTLPRPEYPRPQLVRDQWINLNGEWEFEFDFGCSGKARELYKSDRLSQRITVPFCPESRLSGIGHRDFIPCVWYRRTFSLPADWQGGRVLAHFGAVDYLAEIYVNGRSVCTHRGGYVSFETDITDALRDGENVLTVCAEDDVRSGKQPSGKQSPRYASAGCHYTRTTGIWQTVWLEHVPSVYVAELELTPDVANRKLDICARLGGDFGASGYRLCAEASYEGKPCGSACAAAGWNGTHFSVPLDVLQLWEPGHGRLYDLTVTLQKDGAETDRVTGYFGMRSIDVTPKAILINGKPVFQRLILDQGFYPDGIYTAPSDAELKADIERSLAMGYNGARLHQKIFEPRFLYWADRMGYLCWGEHGNWGLSFLNDGTLMYFLPEWIEAMRRDYSHPCIVGWCPLNETAHLHTPQQTPAIVQAIYDATKRLDPFRPVIDTSGYVHTMGTDIYDCHDYEQDVSVFTENHRIEAGKIPFINHNPEATYAPDRPYFVSEFGGARIAADGGWGYGGSALTVDEFITRYRGLVDSMLDNPDICAFCYTQLTDVEQEVNGLYTYDRQPKFDPPTIAAITSRKAAIEK